MTIQEQADAILARMNQGEADDFMLRAAQDRAVLLDACRRAAPMLEGAINLDIQTAQVILERAINLAERPR